MKAASIMLILSLFISSHVTAGAVDPGEINSEAATLTKILGDEYIARYGSQLSVLIQNGDLDATKDLLDNIKKEIGEMDCFDISAFFGDPSNKLAKNREFDMDLWSSMSINCKEIMETLEPYGGLEEQVTSYLLRNII